MASLHTPMCVMQQARPSSAGTSKQAVAACYSSSAAEIGLEHISQQLFTTMRESAKRLAHCNVLLLHFLWSELKIRPANFALLHTKKALGAMTLRGLPDAGAGEGIRTLDLLFTKQLLYH